MLWAAIKATQQRWPRAVCVVYTGDHDTSKDDILEKVQVQKRRHAHRARGLLSLTFLLEPLQYQITSPRGRLPLPVHQTPCPELHLAAFYPPRPVPWFPRPSVRCLFASRPRCLHRYHGLRLRPRILQILLPLHSHRSLRPLPDHFHRHARLP